MARKRRRQTRTRNDNSMLTIVLAVGAVLLFSGQLTGAQVGTHAEELLSRQQFGTPAGSQIGAGEVCYSEYFGDNVYTGRDVFRTGMLFQGRVSNVIGKCLDGEMYYQVCPQTKASLSQRKLIYGGLIRSTFDDPSLECITHDSRAFLNSAGPEAPPGVYVQPRGPTLTGANL